MINLLRPFLVMCGWCVLAGCGGAPPALPAAPSGIPSNQSFGPRLPDDQIEGSIWEYSGRPEKSDAGTAPTLSGRFRIEGSAVFDVSPRVRLPSRDKVKSKIDQFKRGGPIEIRPPEMPQQKRIGEYRAISNGKKRIDFNDPDTLNGIMIVWPKKDTPDVLLGTYTRKEGRKTAEKWIVELRPIED